MTLEPTHLEIIDQSDQHKGHGGWREGTLSHVKIRINAHCFQGKKRLESHRIIHDLLGQELQDFLHAITISIGSCK